MLAEEEEEEEEKKETIWNHIDIFFSSTRRQNDIRAATFRMWPSAAPVAATAADGEQNIESWFE